MGKITTIFGFNYFRSVGSGFFVALFIIFIMVIDKGEVNKNPDYFLFALVFLISFGLISFWFNPYLEIREEGVVITRWGGIRKFYLWQDVDVKFKERRLGALSKNFNKVFLKIDQSYIKLFLKKESFFKQNIYISSQISNFEEIKEMLSKK